MSSPSQRTRRDSLETMAEAAAALAERETPGLAPFIGPLLTASRDALCDAIRAWIGAPAASVDLVRSVSIASRGATRILVREGQAGLGLVWRLGGAAEGWNAGPLRVTVERSVDGCDPTAHPTSRRWLVDLSRWFASAGIDTLVSHGAHLASLHHRWATLRVIEDRDYRHIEHTTEGMSAFLRPTFRCNQDCHFCWEGRDWPSPPTALVFSWLDQLAESGARRLILCGGEPTIFPELLAVMERASRVHHMSVHMDTNAIRLRDPELTAALRDAGLSSLLVSFHSADAAESDLMTRARSTWSRTVAGIHVALDQGLFVGLNCVVERANFQSLAQHAAFVRSEFVDRHPSNPVRVVNYSQPGKYYERDVFDESMVALDEVRPHLIAATRVLRQAGVEVELHGTCGFPTCASSGETDPLAWRANALRDAACATGRHRDLLPCTGCAAKDHCVGPRREYVERFGDRGLLPFSSRPPSLG